MVGWGLAQVSNWQARGHSVLCGGAWAIEFPIRRLSSTHNLTARVQTVRLLFVRR